MNDRRLLSLIYIFSTSLFALVILIPICGSIGLINFSYLYTTESTGPFDLTDLVEVLGVIAISLPIFPLLRESVYAGFSLSFACILFSRVFTGELPMQPFSVLVLLSISYFSYLLLNTGKTGSETVS